MTTYLLAWNPEKWEYEKIEKMFFDYELGYKKHRWSCISKKIAYGDRVFLTKRGKDRPGIFASGFVKSHKPYFDSHFEKNKESIGKKSLFVDVEFDFIQLPKGKIVIDRHILLSEPFKYSVWDQPGSGREIPASIATKLEKLWIELTQGIDLIYPDEIAEDVKFFEGFKKKIFVNKYERDPNARLKCIEHWGESCSVCRFNFEYFYGSLGKGYIHVHHLKPISLIGEEYEIDPIKDLRPVCPNCHAMLHKDKDVISIEELTKIVDVYGKNIRYI